MACITMLAPVAMATTQLVRVVRYEETSASKETRVELAPLRMSWAVATDDKDKSTLRICWSVDS